MGVEHDVADVVERMDEADSAHVEGLLADPQVVTADVDVGIGQRGHQPRQRDAVMHQFLRVDVDMVLLGQSAETRDVDYSVNGLELLLQYPVLDLLFA